ncbi:MAG: hypothetical protein ACK4K0_11560 [Flavobacteriales bacterium]
MYIAIHISGANFVPPNSLKMQSLIADFITFVNKNPLDIYLMAYSDGGEYKPIQNIVEEEHLTGRNTSFCSPGRAGAYKEGHWYISKEVYSGVSFRVCCSANPV